MSGLLLLNGLPWFTHWDVEHHQSVLGTTARLTLTGAVLFRRISQCCLVYLLERLFAVSPLHSKLVMKIFINRLQTSLSSRQTPLCGWKGNIDSMYAEFLAGCIPLQVCRFCKYSMPVDTEVCSENPHRMKTRCPGCPSMGCTTVDTAGSYISSVPQHVLFILC